MSLAISYHLLESDIQLAFYSSTITMMHGPVNIRFINLFIYLQLSIGDRGGTVVKVLRYKSGGRWFDPS